MIVFEKMKKLSLYDFMQEIGSFTPIDSVSLEKAKQSGINTNYIHESETRVTTNKVRIMGRNQQMMRLDHEHTNDINEAETKKLLENFYAYVDTEKPSLIILEDYNKGVLNEKVIKGVIEYCNLKGIPTSVDPKQKNFLTFK